MGVHQGSILSVTLFSVKINSITQCLKPGVDCSLYVDDFQVCYRSSNVSIIERRLQLCLNKLQQWATDNGFRFSKTKTVCMHICQKRGLHLDPQLFLDKRPIPVVERPRFWGLYLTGSYPLYPILNMLKQRGLKALNILNVIGNTEWGADRKVMLRLYRSLVRSKLDHGCIVYGSARKSYLQMLDPIHNQGLRLWLGEFRTSPVESLYVDAHEPCLGARRAKLSLQYASKIKSLPKHPAHNAVFDNKYMKLFDARPRAIRTFGLCIKQFLTASNIELSDILETPSYFIVPPSFIKPPKIVLDLVHLIKDRTDASIYQQLFMEMLWLVLQFFHQTPSFPWDCLTQHPYLLLKFGQSLKPWSKSKIQALHHMKLEHPLIGMVIRKYVLLNIAKKDIVFYLGTQPYWH